MSKKQLGQKASGDSRGKKSIFGAVFFGIFSNKAPISSEVVQRTLEESRKTHAQTQESFTRSENVQKQYESLSSVVPGGK